MRTLAKNEMQNVSGGIGVETVAIAAVGLTALWMISSISNQGKVVYEPVVTTYDVVTPVYDGYGQYVGDMVDTYSQTDYVPVRI